MLYPSCTMSTAVKLALFLTTRSPAAAAAAPGLRPEAWLKHSLLGEGGRVQCAWFECHTNTSWFFMQGLAHLVTHLLMPNAHVSFAASKVSLQALLTRRTQGPPVSTRKCCCTPSGSYSHAACCVLMAISTPA